MVSPAALVLVLSLAASAQEPPVVHDTAAPAEQVEAGSPPQGEVTGEPQGEEAAEAPAQHVSARQERLAALAAERAAMKKRQREHLLLAIAGLLVLLLIRRLLKVPEASDAAAAAQPGAPVPHHDHHHHHHRRIALNHEELGHFVVELARSQDLPGFRELFLNGQEAARHFGLQEGQDYLERRSDQVLGPALLRISQEVGMDCIYRGAEDLGEGLLGVRLRAQDGAERVVQVGTVVDIEGGSRLVMPA